MDDNLKHIELIEAYHEDKLSPEAKVEFEVRLLVDRELQEENELYKKKLYGFHDIKADQIRAKLRQIDSELDQKKKGGSGRAKYYWIAGVAAFIAIICFVYFQQFSEPRFSAKYIPEDPGLPVLMGTGNKLDFDNAMSEFKAEEYDKAIIGFSKLLKTNPENDTTLFYLGNCYLHTKNYEMSMELLGKLNRQSNSIYNAKGQYYLALAYWAAGNSKEAKELFTSIAASSGHPFQSQSKTISNKLQ